MVFFPSWDLLAQFYFIIFLFGNSTFDQWCISDDYKTFSNQSCHNFFLLIIVYDLLSDGVFFPTWIYMCKWILCLW